MSGSVSGSLRLQLAAAAAASGGGGSSTLDALYDRKRDNKSVRVLTVLVYVLCVSLAAIMLSLYYVFFWEPRDKVTPAASAFLAPTDPTAPCLPHAGAGGSSDAVNGSTIPPPYDDGYTEMDGESTTDTNVRAFEDHTSTESTQPSALPVLADRRNVTTGT